MRALDEYKFRFDRNKQKQVGQGDGKTRVGDVIAQEGQKTRGRVKVTRPATRPEENTYEAEVISTKSLH